MGVFFKKKVFFNKRTDQASIILSKKEFHGDVPKFIFIKKKMLKGGGL